MTATNALVPAGSNALTLGGAIDGIGSLVKNGSGILTLGAANGYQGGTTLNAGGLVLGNAQSLGSGACRPRSACKLRCRGCLP